ncbi:KTSC domain-containing protein [Hoeflea algicola]|uniref:KTSC domain-containing protein n=1 Tax=Hoeflea algicola TaxID=2983763 RepID=UPI003CE5197E
MPRFNSTAIAAAEYNASTRILQIWFVESGGPYSYYGVPAAIFEGLCNSRSKGGYFNDHIRDRYSVG